MQLHKLVNSNNDITRFRDIRRFCNQYLIESNGKPLYRALPNTYGEYKRVKVRHRKYDPIDSLYEGTEPRTRLKAVFAQSNKRTMSTDVSESAFYIFPVDGYKFLYSKEIYDSSRELKTVLEVLTNQYTRERAVATIQHVMQFSYTDVMLEEGINAGCEVMLYDFPAFYAVRSDVVPYDQLLTKLK